MEKLVLTFSQIAGGENCFVKTRAKEQSPYIYPYQYTNENEMWSTVCDLHLEDKAEGWVE